MHVVQIFLLSYEMELALEVVVLLDGSQWYVAKFTVHTLVWWCFKAEGNATESGKTGYTNFKRVVWHNSFHELLATIRTLSKIGRKIKCADGEVRYLFPAILMLSADYEEQYDRFSIF